MKTFLRQHHALPASSTALRKRVHSVRRASIQRDFDMPQDDIIMNRLQKGLERQLDREVLQPTEPSLLLPDNEVIKIENKLWRYFVGRMELVRDKVEKERLNVCEREIQSIKEQVLRKRNSNKEQIAKAEARMQGKNRQIHGLFEEMKHQRIMQEDAAALMKAKKRRNQEEADHESTEWITRIRESIEGLRGQIAKLEVEVQHSQRELFKIEEEWKSFLRHFLKEGYYFQDGTARILREMVQADYTPTLNDFPSFLDHTSRHCLLAQYKRLKEEAASPKSTNQFRKSQHVSDSRRNMRQLADRDTLIKIYEGTRDYMTDWLRNQDWKRQINLPRIQSTKSAIEKPKDWREEEKKRLCFIDDKERYRKVRAVLFGSKVDTVA